MNTWEDIINQESKKDYFLELMEKINFERTNYIVYIFFLYTVMTS